MSTPEVGTLTVAEVMAQLRLSRDKVTDMCKSGELPARKFGGRWRIHTKAFQRWMDDWEKSA